MTGGVTARCRWSQNSVPRVLFGFLAAENWRGQGARLELIEKGWQEENGRFVPVWRQQSFDISNSDVGRLVDQIWAVWVSGRTSQVIFGPTANTAYTGIVLNVCPAKPLFTL